jgi:hypothetical protein
VIAARPDAREAVLRLCSAIGVLPERSGGATILAQNWDWHPDLIESRVVWTITEPGGRWLTTLTEAGILAKVCLNSRGLVPVAGAEDTHFSEARRPRR